MLTTPGSFGACTREEEVSILLDAEVGGWSFPLSSPSCLLAWSSDATSKGASEVPWVLGLQLGPPPATGSREPYSSVYLGSSLLMMEGPVRAVDWVTRVAVDGDGDPSTWSRLPRVDEQAASALAAYSLE